MGTPKTLLQAIKNGSSPEEIERHVRDYLNQVLATVSLEGHEAAVERIQELIKAKSEDGSASTR